METKQVVRIRHLYCRSLILSALIFIASCAPFSEPTLDSSSEANLRASLAEIISALPENERREASLEFSRIENTYLGHLAFRYEGEDRSARQRRFMNAVSGMNAEAISLEAERVQQAWRLGDLLGIRADYKYYQEALSVLSKVELLSYELIRTDKNIAKAKLEAVVRNDSAYPIYSAVFTADMFDQNGESVGPYQMYFEIPDGLHPGEQKVIEAYSDRRLDTDGNPIRQFKNFKAYELYSGSKGDRDNMIAGINLVRLPTLEGVQKAEAKYYALYGDDEPEEWTQNILRDSSRYDPYRGKKHHNRVVSDNGEQGR